MHPSVTVYRNSVFDFINSDFEVLTLAGDCLFTEGPVWNPSGFYLFSDTTANTICRIAENQPKEIFLANSGTENTDDPELKPGQGGSNALAYDASGRLLVCRHGSHDIAVLEGEELHPYISRFQGKPFNSPNDFILHKDGRLYFSDPPYGLKDSQLNPERFQPLAGVYCWRDGEIELICDRYQYPNGVCLSNDQRHLYICSNKPFEKFISLYDTTDSHFIKIFAEENSDGIEVDAWDHVYLCNKDGIIILDRDGERLALIQLPTIPANICWGGKEGKDLFVTARENIFLIKNLQK